MPLTNSLVRLRRERLTGFDCKQSMEINEEIYHRNKLNLKVITF